MRGVNKAIIAGHLGADPETRQFNNGSSVTNISVATSEQWTDKQTGEKRESTEWHRISLFNRLGEIAAQYLRKGSLVYIEGSIRTRKWQDQNGQDRYSTEIRADSMQMLGNGNNNAQQNNNQNYHKNNGYQQNNNQNFNPNTQQNNNQQTPMANNQPQQQPQQQFNNQMSGQQTAGGPADDDVPFAPAFGG